MTRKLSIALLALGLAACGESTGPQSPAAGAWTYVGNFGDCTVTMRLELEGAGQLDARAQGGTYQCMANGGVAFTHDLSGHVVREASETGGDIQFRIRVTHDGDKVMEIQNDGDATETSLSGDAVLFQGSAATGITGTFSARHPNQR